MSHLNDRREGDAGCAEVARYVLKVSKRSFSPEAISSRKQPVETAHQLEQPI
jgi:hypothetical protein